MFGASKLPGGSEGKDDILFVCCCDKIPDREQLKGERAMSVLGALDVMKHD